MSRKWLRILWVVGLCACGPTCVARVSADPPPNSDRGARPVPTDTAAQFRQISDGIDGIKQELRALRSNMLATDMKADDALRQVARLEQQLEEMRRDLSTLRRPASPLNTTSGYGPAPGAATTGQVQLVNQFDSQMTVVVNGVSYRLAPLEQRAVTVPAGIFSYEVLNAPDRPMQERTVAPGGVFTIRLFPVGI